jgi:hypothetical protein
LSESSKRILSTLMVMGAQSPEKAMTAEELAAKLSLQAEAVGAELNGLVETGYARRVEGILPARIYLTGTGVITASSTYS